MPGGDVTVAPALDEIALFGRAGSLLLLGPDLQYTGEKAADPLEVRILVPYSCPRTALALPPPGLQTGSSHHITRKALFTQVRVFDGADASFTLYEDDGAPPAVTAV